MRRIKEFGRQNWSVFAVEYICVRISQTYRDSGVIYPLLLVHKLNFFFLLGRTLLGKYYITVLVFIIF